MWIKVNIAPLFNLNLLSAACKKLYSDWLIIRAQNQFNILPLTGFGGGGGGGGMLTWSQNVDKNITLTVIKRSPQLYALSAVAFYYGMSRA